ncbi:hypothetical protein BDC45DRAFT_587054 [Circinella umbellata]|nr:hypothetical protein BDC45DRAFT_587054 [Circinella umbellata]
MSSNWNSTLTPQEVQAYGQFFNAANGGKSAVVNGQEAVTFFARSGIPNEILSDIWETADRDNLGYLTPETFSIALKLIASAQHVVPLPQFEGFNPDATSPPENLGNEVITPSEREKYLGIFRAHQPVQGVLDAEKVRNIFNKSKLPNEYLAQIWNLADLRKAGNLNQTEFIIAMHYIAKLMDRSITTLPVQLPAKIYGSAAGSIQSSPVLRRTSMSPATLMQQRQFTGGSISSIPPLPRPQQRRTESIESLGSKAFSHKTNSMPTSVSQQPTAMWDVTSQQKMQSDILFNQIDTKRTGVIQGNEAVEFFKTSQLPDTDLARVWDLADLEQNGQLTPDEFAVAMYLIQSRIAGKPLPSVLPKSLIPPSKANVATITSPQQQMYQSPPSMITSPPSQQQQPEEQPPALQEDLLGDFGNNEELTSETNAVNQLQYKISNVKSTTTQVKSQKEVVSHSLEQTQQQKQNLEVQTAQLMNSQQAQVEQLAELQQLIKTEEPGWIQVQQEHDAAQKELEEVRTEVTSMKQSLEQGQTDSEEFRRRVHDVQEETASLINQLEKLRIYVNKKAGATATTTTTTTPEVAETHISVNKDDHQKLTFDDIFSPQPPSAASAASPITTTVTQNVDDDFDAIFAPQPATAPTTNTVAIAEKRQPPPPPPPSRRTTIRRQEPQQAAKKSRAPPPPPPSATATAIGGAAVAAGTVAAIHESDEYESDSTASSETEDSEDEKIQSTTKAETTSPQAATSSAPTQELFVSKEKEATHTESIEEENDQDTSLPVVEHDTKTSPAENIIAESSLIAEKQVQPFNDSVEPNVIEVQSKKKNENETQALDKSEESEESDVVMEAREHDEEEKQRVSQPELDEPEIKTVEEDGKETSTPYVMDDPESTIKIAKSLTEPKEVYELETQELTVEPPKEEDRVTSEILSDKITSDFKESIAAVPSTSQEDDTLEADPKESVGVKNEPSETPEEPMDEYFTPPENKNDDKETTLVKSLEKNIKVEESIVSTENKAPDVSIISSELPESNYNNKDNISTKELEQPQERSKSLEKTAPPETDLGASTESFVSVSELPLEEEQKDDDDDIPLAKLKSNVFEEQASHQDEKDNDEVSGTFVSAVGATVAPIVESSTMSNKNQDSTDHNIPAIRQGDKLTDEATLEKEEKMDKDAPQETKPLEQEQNDIENKKGKDTEESSADDDYLSVTSDDDNSENIVDSNGNHDAITSHNASMQDNKESKPIDDQTEPSVKQNEEQRKEETGKSLQEDEKRVETGTSLASTTKKEGETGAMNNPRNTSDDDSVASDKDRLKGENTTHDNYETPKDIANSESSITNGPQERSLSDDKNINKNNKKETGQGLSAHDVITKKDEIEEKEDQSTHHEDFDAVFMERPNNQERTSSDGGGESFEIISSATSPTEKRQTVPSADEFDAAFASELQNAKVVDESSFFNQEDFDAAFAEELTDAKVIQNDDKNNNDNNNEKYVSSNKKQGDKLSWASNFGGFSFDDNFDTKEHDEEWDSIFGGNDGKAGETEHVGFQDAFSATSFNDNQTKDDDTKTNNNDNNPFDTVPVTEGVVADSSPSPSSSSSPLPPPTAATTSSASATENNNNNNKESLQEDKGIISTGNSNLDQLIIMGFNRDLAKEALNRYDQDLEKATNFLLDLAAK